MSEPIAILPGPLAAAACGLRDRLQLVFPPALFDFQWFPSRITAGAWQKLTRRTPLVGIGFNRFNGFQTYENPAVHTEWTVFLASRNERGQEAVLFGDRAAPGQFAMAQAAVAVLHGFSLPNLGSILVTDASNSFVDFETDSSLGLTTVELMVPLCLSLGDILSGPDATSVDLTKMQVDWHFDGAAVSDTIIVPKGLT